MSELHQTLQGLHEELRRAERLEPRDRALLESILGDIRRLLKTAQSSSPTEQPVNAMTHGDALEGAAVRLEAGHPGVAGAIRAVLDALGKAGI
jgi:predicted component of type VI protein secretion system